MNLGWENKHGVKPCMHESHKKSARMGQMSADLTLVQHSSAGRVMGRRLKVNIKRGGKHVKHRIGLRGIDALIEVTQFHFRSIVESPVKT